MSFFENMCSVWLEPNILATFLAYLDSSYALNSKPILNVCNELTFSDAIDAIKLESIHPEKKTPKGTSDISCSLIDEFKISLTFFK